MQDDVDETILRIAAALRPLPDVDAAQKARVLVAVAAERERDRAQSRSVRVRRGLLVRVLASGGLVAAAAVTASVWLRRPAPPAPSLATTGGATAGVTAGAAAPSAVAPSASSAQLAARDLGGVALQPVELVLRAPAAHRVSVVGDFNGWDARAATMTRDPASGLWSQTLALRPGRHVYAFVVDDSVWMRDPRTPAAPDADFGRPGSVLLVGRP